jgi:hypothetical protein
MAKKLMSFRIDSDLATRLSAAVIDHNGVKASEAVNAAMHQFLSVGEAKQKKYLKRYRTRLLEKQDLEADGDE